MCIDCRAINNITINLVFLSSSRVNFLEKINHFEDLLRLLQVVAEELPNNSSRETHPNKFKDGFETLKVLDPFAASWTGREAPLPPLKLRLPGRPKKARKRYIFCWMQIQLLTYVSVLQVTNVEDDLMNDIIASIEIPEINTIEEDENSLQDYFTIFCSILVLPCLWIHLVSLDNVY
ncbi:hypothetical protein M9H77_22790 [Catharanthus roseus]|uniref:Uncharacterized protein n=1 Tax=Catharanthus roseus TaxID=4058 RepID=A0ACC0AU09_CATRO|nr:hypothetical protein M9H77_22790 [Catharanthus roseus]